MEFSGNRARSLRSDRVEVIIATEQLVSNPLLFLPNLFVLIIWTKVKMYLHWKFLHGFPVVFQYIASDRIFADVAYSDFTDNSYDYLQSKGLF